MTDEKKVHPLRRKHRRGKRGGRRHKGMQLAPPTPEAPPQPSNVISLRSRLSLLAKSNHG